MKQFKRKHIAKKPNYTDSVSFVVAASIAFIIVIAVLAYIEYQNNKLVDRPTTLELALQGKIKPAMGDN